MSTLKRQVRLKRAYDAPAKSDGRRILVDRIWPRGLSKQTLHIDDWAKDVAPSTELRRWFGHERTKWDGFKKRYFRELDERPDAVDRLLASSRRTVVTLVFGAKDALCNNAAALKEYLQRRTRIRRAQPPKDYAS